MEEWLEKKKYTSAIEFKYSLSEVADIRLIEMSRESNAVVQYYPTWKTVKVYVCPRGLHNGNRGGCGRKCMNAQGEEPEYVEELTVKVLAVKRETILNSRECLVDRHEHIQQPALRLRRNLAMN
jgi:hypothetical protein